MDLLSLFLIAVGLSMDAFAVAICKGLAMPKVTIKKALVVGLWFGGFQALMPLIGYYLGTTFDQFITSFDHWIAFGLLVLIGANMIKESLKKDADACNTDSASLKFKVMLLLAVATSIDALAVGVSFAFLSVDILLAVALIGITTFILSIVGVKIGNVFGSKYKSKSELVGGIILVLIGIKILFEHLSIL